MSSEVRTNRPMALRAELVRKMSEAGGKASELHHGGERWPASPSDRTVSQEVEVVRVAGALWQYFAADLAGAIRTAAERTRRDVVVAINSPGGDVAGMADLVAAMRTARAAVESKGGRLVALINDEACSAGYWLASQATEVWATRLAEVGCLGVYAVLYDESQAFAASGVQPVLVANDGAGLKGAGLPGLPISEDLVAQVRRSCNAATAQFVADVAAGRGKPVEAITPLATGAVWTAREAVAMGLVDKVTAGGLAEAVAELSNDRAGQAASRAGRAAGRTAARRGYKMDDKNKQAITMEELEGMPGGPELIQQIKDSVAAEAAAKAAAEKAEGDKPKAATVAELRAAFPNQPEFVLAALESGESLLAAKARMGDMAALKLEAMAKQVAELQGKLAAAGGAGGTAPVRTAGNPGSKGKVEGTVQEQYNAEVERLMAEHKCSRMAAFGKLASANPTLNREYFDWKRQQR
ncbi:MAG: S49 family peptidase [Planctomycetaceae bacterium]|jgi:ClpP class serine protease|nr:S49 family peptidase [Planctomycetaceae bacterium]